MTKTPMHLTDLKVLWDAMTEDELLFHVLELADSFGWKHYHVFEQKPYAKRSSKGFPDVVMARGNVLIFVELKDQKGTLTKDQEVWLRLLWGMGCDGLNWPHVGLWRPEDWYRGIIEEVLDLSSTTWIETELDRLILGNDYPGNPANES